MDSFRRRGWILSWILSLLLVAASCGVEDSDPTDRDETDAGGDLGLNNQQQCLAPIGTYRVEFTDRGGSCSLTLIEPYLEPRDEEFQETEDRECGQHTVLENDSRNGCDLLLTIIRTATDEGFEDASATLQAECWNGLCSHQFDVQYQAP